MPNYVTCSCAMAFAGHNRKRKSQSSRPIKTKCDGCGREIAGTPDDPRFVYADGTLFCQPCDDLAFTSGGEPHDR